MDAFEFNKIAGALLATLLFVVVLNNVGDLVMHPTVPDTPAYVVEGMETADAEAADAKAEKEPEPALGALLAAASPEKGEKVAKKCAACHSFEEGGPNKVGPNLWGVIGHEKAAHAGFAYSDALKGLGGTWTFEDLNHFLTRPKDFAPGTKMSFAGLKKPTDRADLLAYLRSLSDSPVPLPAD
jgi:cytochrome c